MSSNLWKRRALLAGCVIVTIAAGLTLMPTSARAFVCGGSANGSESQDGAGATATGGSATACGPGATASGADSVAVGNASTASGASAIAVGLSSSASGDNSSAY